MRAAQLPNLEVRLSFLRRMAATAVAAGTLLALCSVPAGAGSLSLTEDFESLSTATSWADGSTHGPWKSRFDGYGRVGVEHAGSKVLLLKPKASDSPNETHAALVTSRKTFSSMELSVRAKTVRQLRSPSANAWEAAWVLWSFKDNTHFYYVALKPNGWELGKADPAYPGAQRFLATGSSVKFPVGTWNSVKVRQVGNRMSVWANGQLLTTFTDTERPYTSGAIGLYNEDAKTFFDNVRVAGL